MILLKVDFQKWVVKFAGVCRWFETEADALNYMKSIENSFLNLEEV